MPRFALPLLALLAATAATHARDEPELNPPVPSITLTIDGVPHTLNQTQPATILIDGVEHRVSFDFPTALRFDGRFVRFDYPAAMLPQQPTSTHINTLTRILGYSGFCFIFEYNNPKAIDTLTGELINQVRTSMVGEAATTDTTLTTPAGPITGKGVAYALAEWHVYMEVYTFNHNNQTTAVIIQDARENPDEPSRQFTQLRTQLAETLHIKAE